MQKNVWFIPLALCAALCACADADKADRQIARLEKEYGSEITQEQAAELIRLYRDAAKAQPDKHERNLAYLTAAAELQFDYWDDAVGPVRWIHQGIADHSDYAQDLTETMRVLARLWNAYTYKSPPAIRLDPDDIDRMRFNLERNQQWVDSALARLDREMGDVAVKNPVPAAQFIEIADGYSTLLEKKAPAKAADILMKAAGVAKSIEDFNKAVRLYNRVYENFAEYPRRSTALFMIAFVYANDLGNVEKARDAYERFLKAFPNDELSESARIELGNLGKTPEEIIREFEARNKQVQ